MKFDKNIPLPKSRAEYRHYHLDQMAVGDSFFAPDADGHTVHRLQSLISHLKLKQRGGSDRAYTSRRCEGGVRVWRIR